MKIIRFFLAICAILLLAVPVLAETGKPSHDIGVKSAILYDLDNDKILYEHNADEQIPPASLTKVMSLFLAMDFIRDGHAALDTDVVISKEAASTGGSLMGLRANEIVPLKKLLYGMAVSSGNDASHAVAETVGGSVDNFIKMMNAKAKELGMDRTHFLTPHGLPARGQVTTARDMLTLGRAYLRAYPDTLQMHNTTLMEHRGYRTWNKNPLLGQYPGADGLKSGWIRASGYNLIFTAKKDSRRLLAVILGAPDTYVRAGEACRLLDAGFLACDDSSMPMAEALLQIPYDSKKIDPLKTGRDAGLLKVRRFRKAPVFVMGPPGTLLPSPRSLQKNHKPVKAAVKSPARKTAKKGGTVARQPKRSHHAQRVSKSRRG